MDPLIFVLLVIIILSSGGIAVFADYLGRKIGKKKLSFRSMRPKNVARLGTFLAGVLISTITITLVFFTSSDIRKWIQVGTKLIKQAQVLSDKNAKLESAIQLETDKITRLDGDAKIAQRNLQEAQAKLSQVQSQLATANNNLAEARRRVDEGKVALAKNETLLRKNQQLLAAKQSKLAGVSKSLASAQANYATLRKSYKAVNKEREQANEEVMSLRAQRDELSGVVEKLKTDSVQLAKDKEEAKQELETARGDLHQGVLELDQVKSSLEEAKASLKQAQEDTLGYRRLTVASRAQPMIYKIGQEVQRIEIPAHLSATQARQVWDRLMSSTEQAASERGAMPNAGSACVFLPNLQPNGPDGPEATPEEQRQAILEKITGQDQDLVLISQAEVNTFKGESVPLKIVGYPNPVVYHKGEVLAELHVGKNWQGAQAFSQFNDFIEQKVHDKIRSKMIPVSGQENSLIEIAPEKTLELVDKLARAPRDTILQVSCRAETRAADSLQLDFRFK